MKYWLFIALLLTFVIRHPTSAHATQVQEITTPGGITAWLVEEHSVPLVAVKIVFKGAGHAYDPAGKEGRAAMAAGLLMEGAGELGSRDFNAALEAKAIQMNVAVDDDMFHVTLSTLSEHRAAAFSYLGMALTQPRLEEESVARIKRQSLTIIAQQEQNPGFVLSRRWQQLAFGDHPYRRTELGSPDAVGAIEKTDIAEFISRYLGRENIIISVVGDIAPAELSALLDANLAALPAKYQPDQTVAPVAVAASEAIESIPFDIPQTMIMFGSNGLLRTDPDYLPAFVMNEILGGNGLTSLLSKEIREKRGLTYGIGSALAPQLAGGQWRGQFAVRTDGAAEALAALNAQLAEFAERGPSDRQLADAKRYLTGSFALQLDSNADIANFLCVMQLYHLGRDYMDRRNAMIEAVTRPQIMAAAKRLLHPGALLITMIGKPQPTAP